MKDHSQYHICIFAGTTEGRQLAQFLGSQQFFGSRQVPGDQHVCGRQRIRTTVCVATEYGGELIPQQEGIEVLTGRLLPEEIVRLFRERGFDMVIDATHPYATAVTENIRSACRECGVVCHRLRREGSDSAKGAVYVENASAAASYLKDTEGSILLTTGSKDLPVYASIPDFAERVYARVLPMESSLKACAGVKLPASHIIAMQGPFSEDLNTAMLNAISAKWLVTKDGGQAGGYEEKVRAAEKTGTRLLVIGRPQESGGLSLREIVQLLCREYGCTPEPEVAVVGIGPGRPELMTREVREAIRSAQCLIGAGRMIREYAGPGQMCFEAVSPEKISGYILGHCEVQTFAVLMSGDIGFYSGTKKLLPLLKGCRVRLCPGISSLVYLCGRLGKSYEEVMPVSLHGRTRDIAEDVRRHGKVFALVGGEDGMQDLCRTLTDAGLGGVKMYIGERLSYPDEKITEGTAEELAAGSYQSLSAALIENESAHPMENVLAAGIVDEAFLRGNSERGVIPMTKSEVRAICLSKLQPKIHSVCWDIGAGTGSVAIEMARIAQKGQVFAIEKEEDSADLIRQNAARFRTGNITVIPGTAPEVLQDLPAPDHVFIGGSGSRMREIIDTVLSKNRHARITATAIALETIAELTACGKELHFREMDVVAVNIARDRKAGPWHLMMGQNPIYIFTMQGPEM